MCGVFRKLMLNRIAFKLHEAKDLVRIKYQTLRFGITQGLGVV